MITHSFSFRRSVVAWLIALLIGLAACVGKPTSAPPSVPSASEPADRPAGAATEVLAPQASQTIAATETSEPKPRAIVLPKLSPATRPPAILRLTIAPGLEPAAQSVLPFLTTAGLQVAHESVADADLRLEPSPSDDARLVYERIFVPVDRFSTFLEEVTLAELRDAWTGSAPSPNFTTIYASQESVGELEMLLGPAGPAVRPLPAEAISEALWTDLMGLGIVPFEALHLRLRALRLDGQSAVDNRLDQTRWPLASRAWLRAETEEGRTALARLAETRPVTNRRPEKLTVLVQTGVTAIARGSAAAIERTGDNAFVARIVGPELAAADITTINNEIPFMPGCPLNTDPDNIVFCSKPEYFEAFALSGADLIGLTGNHMNDFGTDVFLETLAFYDQKGLLYYGGGRNDEAARGPLLIEHHGNRFGFLGANQYGPEAYWTAPAGNVSAWAGPDAPGAARFDREQMIQAVQELRPLADVVVAELQHTEFNHAGQYQTAPIPQQAADFRALSDAGADIVVGVQAHTPQAVELRNNGIILYGLGNLYFDQIRNWATRTGLIARSAIYDGRLLHTELLVTVIERNMQVRWATPEERVQVLQEVFQASGWR